MREKEENQAHDPTPHTSNRIRDCNTKPLGANSFLCANAEGKLHRAICTASKDYIYITISVLAKLVLFYVSHILKYQHAFLLELKWVIFYHL